MKNATLQTLTKIINDKGMGMKGLVLGNSVGGKRLRIKGRGKKKYG